MPNAADMKIDEQWSALFSEQLSSARKTAENWRTGLVALLGLVSIFSVIQAPNVTKDLEPWAVWTAGGCVLLSAIAAIVGAVAALRAAFGAPEQLTRAAFHRMGGLDGLNLQRAYRARRQLRVAQGMTYVALAALGGAVALTWYAPTRVTDLVKATTTIGRVVCGSLVTSEKGALQIDSKTGGSTLLKLSDIMELSIVESCDD